MNHAMIQKSHRVTIIIPHYNQKECLQRLLPSVDSQTYGDFETIIIDDRTPDQDTVAFIRDFIKDKPNMQLVQNPENLRFIKTCNKGITLAKGDYVCFLNSDTEIKSSFVERNVAILDGDPSIGGLSCVVIDQYGNNWFSGGRYKRGSPHNFTDDFVGVRSADYVAGTAAFYRSEVFSRIGPFDASLVMYHEDVEFGLRMRRHTNYRLCVFSDKLVTHYLVPSIPRSELCYHLNRNRLAICREYALAHVPEVMIRIFVREVAARLILAPFALVALKSSLSSRWVRFAAASFRGMASAVVAKAHSGGACDAGSASLSEEPDAECPPEHNKKRA